LASYRDDEEMDALITSTLDQMISTLSDYQRQDQRVKRRQKPARGGAKVKAILAILENRRRDGEHETITREQLRAVREVLEEEEGDDVLEGQEEDEEMMDEDYTDPNVPRDLEIDSFFR